jgi:ComF family protein
MNAPRSPKASIDPNGSCSTTSTSSCTSSAATAALSTGSNVSGATPSASSPTCSRSAATGSRRRSADGGRPPATGDSPLPAIYPLLATGCRLFSAGLDALAAASLAPVCVACERALDTPLSGPVCTPCWQEARAARGQYQGALRRIIQAFKYDGRRSLAQPLGTLLRDASARALGDADCVVPVPLHPWRRLRRGFNQAADLASCLGPPVVAALWRVRPTASQAGLTADARRRNVRGAFRLSPLLSSRTRQMSIEGRIVVLVDDVMTTGATLGACARVLEAAGAREVRLLAVARAPLDVGRASSGSPVTRT